MFAGLRLLTPEQEEGDEDNTKQNVEEEKEDELAGREGRTTLKVESSPHRIVNLPTNISINPTTPAVESSDNQTKTHVSPLFFASLPPRSSCDKQPNGNSESECDTMGSVDFLPQLLDESTFKSPPPSSMSFHNNNLDYNRRSWNTTSDASSSSSTNASSTTSSSRKMRQSLTAAALKAIKDTLVESTQNMVTNMSGSALLTPPNGTAILTKAITEANEIKEKRVALKLKKLKRLQEMTENTIHEPRNFLIEETFQLIQALNIDVGFALPEHFDLEAVLPSIASPSDFRENISQKVTNLIQVINDDKQCLTSQMESVD